MENVEEIKTQYEKEIERLRGVAQTVQTNYQNKLNVLKEQEQQVLNDYTADMQKINVGIERLRGAYTALCDLEDGKEQTLIINKMLEDIEPTEIEPEKDVVDDVVNEALGEIVEQKPEITEEVKEKAHEVVKKAVEQGKVTKYEDFAKTDLAKETSLTDEELAALETATKSEVKESDVPEYLKEEYSMNK